MSSLSFEELLQKYINQSCTPAEVDRLFELMEKGEAGAAGKEALQQHFQQGLQPTGYTNNDLQERLQSRLALVKQQIVAEEPAPQTRGSIWRWVAVAATVLLVATGIYYWHTAPKRVAATTQQETEVQPGSDKAVLTLADGKTISLDSSTHGIIGREGQTAINQRGGQIIYDASNAQSGEVVYNTLSTPRGGQYQLTLPDGSRVWLNAASSIRFPAVFNDSARLVYITGEVYFEVSKQTAKNGRKVPFHVMIPGAEIKVLGTHFNVNAYDDEDAAKTTLLEGAIVVKANESSVTLKPGQQAVLSRAHSPLTIAHSPDLEQVLAWKNGLFRFDGIQLSTMMRQLARWYDVEVTFAPGAPVSELFNGAIQRSLQLSQVLTGMDAMGIHVKREGKHLIVMP